jgi:hypothetical protein
MLKAQELVKKAASDSDQLQRAKSQTELVLTTFCASMGCKAEINWISAADSAQVAAR